MRYLTELHLHTSEMSPCGRVPAEEMVRLYHEAGYKTLVFTDHYYPRIYLHHGGMSHEALADAYRDTVKRAENAAAGYGMTVLSGIEIRFTDADNDYLVYGLDFGYLKTHAHLMEMGLKDFSALCRREGFFLIQAHPFRNGMRIQDPSLLDAMEVYNGNPRHDSRNDAARLWAKKYGLIGVSGSDAHQLPDVARGGIVTEERIDGMVKLIGILREGRFSLIEDGKEEIPEKAE